MDSMKYLIEPYLNYQQQCAWTVNTFINPDILLLWTTASGQEIKISIQPEHFANKRDKDSRIIITTTHNNDTRQW